MAEILAETWIFYFFFLIHLEADIQVRNLEPESLKFFIILSNRK